MAHILVVEDYESVRDLLCEAVTDMGHTADCVATKAEADALLGPGSHELVVTNVVLPDGSGHDLASRAVALGIKVVLMSGHPSELQAMQVAEIAHLQKPFHLDEFRRTIQDHLGRSAVRAPRRSDSRQRNRLCRSRTFIEAGSRNPTSKRPTRGIQLIVAARHALDGEEIAVTKVFDPSVVQGPHAALLGCRSVLR